MLQKVKCFQSFKLWPTMWLFLTTNRVNSSCNIKICNQVINFKIKKNWDSFRSPDGLPS